MSSSIKPHLEKITGVVLAFSGLAGGGAYLAGSNRRCRKAG